MEGTVRGPATADVSPERCPGRCSLAQRVLQTPWKSTSYLLCWCIWRLPLKYYENTDTGRKISHRYSN